MNEQLTLNVGDTSGRLPGAEFHGLQILTTCPNWPLFNSFGSGDTAWKKMCSAVAETFGQTEATHLHFYLTCEKAEGVWEELKSNLPETIKTVSFLELKG